MSFTGFWLVVTCQRDSYETFNRVAAETPLKIWGFYCCKLLTNTRCEGGLPETEFNFFGGEKTLSILAWLAGVGQVAHGGEPDLQWGCQAQAQAQAQEAIWERRTAGGTRSVPGWRG